MAQGGSGQDAHIRWQYSSTGITHNTPKTTHQKHINAAPLHIRTHTHHTTPTDLSIALHVHLAILPSLPGRLNGIAQRSQVQRALVDVVVQGVVPVM